MIPTGESARFAKDCAEIAQLDLPWATLSDSSILITGASGMIPMYVFGALACLNDRDDLRIRFTLLVHNEERAKAQLGALTTRSDVSLIVGDVADVDLGRAHYDHVYHGASPARPHLHATNPAGTLKANVLGTLNILDQIRSDSSSFILMSSSEVYGTQVGDALIAEDSYGPLNPYSVRACYYEGKRAAETAVAVYSAQYGIRATVVRFGHIYGPGMALDDGRVQADFAADVNAGRNIVLQGDGTHVRTYTYVSDAVAGLFYAQLRGTEPIYNVADPDGAVSIRELAHAFIAAKPHLNLEVNYAHEKNVRGVNTQRRLGLDSSKLLALGWHPRVPLPQGAARMLGALDE